MTKLPPGPPMTLGNMRANGVRRLDLHCWKCHHSAVIDADRWPDDVTVVSLRQRLVCSNCGIVAPTRGRTGRTASRCRH